MSQCQNLHNLQVRYDWTLCLKKTLTIDIYINEGKPISCSQNSFRNVFLWKSWRDNHELKKKRIIQFFAAVWIWCNYTNWWMRREFNLHLRLKLLPLVWNGLFQHNIHIHFTAESLGINLLIFPLWHPVKIPFPFY